MLLNIIKPSYDGKAVEASGTRLINMIIVRNKINDKYEYILSPTPGLSSYVTIPKSPVRGMHEKNGTLYVVGGDTLYKVDQTDTVTSIGTVGDGDNHYEIVSNTDYLLMSNGEKNYTYRFSTSTLTELTDTDFPSSTASIAAVGDYFFAHSGKTIYFSGVNDPTSWSALDFITAELTQEDVVALHAFQDFLLIAGTRRTQIAQIVGGTDPVRNLLGLLPKYGCAAKNSISEGTEAVYFLARGMQGGLTVLKIDRSFEAVKIADEGLHHKLDGYTTVSDAEGFLYQKEGREYYQLTFPTEGKTWLYDVELDYWSELQSEVAGTQDRHLARYYSPFKNKQIVSLFNSSVLYSLEYNVFTDAGQTVQRLVRTAPWIAPDRNEFKVSRIEIDIQDGSGIASGQGSAPLLMVRYSMDGGGTFTRWFHKDAGKIGAYGERILLNRLGQGRSLVFELQMSDPINWRLFGIWAHITILNERRNRGDV